MGNEWEVGNTLYIFIEVDLWLFLFLKGENSGGMGCVLETVIDVYSRQPFATRRRKRLI